MSDSYEKRLEIERRYGYQLGRHVERNARSDLHHDIKRQCTRTIYWCERAKRILAGEPVPSIEQAEREANATNKTGEN